MSSYLKGLADKINGVEKQSFTKELDINSLVPSSNNFYGIREIEELAASIKENGLMHNIVVRKRADGIYEIISGERRYHALKSLNYKQVPCQVKENLSDLDAELILIQANAEQRELTSSEKMEGIKRLKAVYEKKKANGEQLPKGKTRDLIGADMKLSGVQVGRYQKVDKDLIKPLKEKLDKEEITLTQAHTISNLTEEEQQIIHEEIKDLDPKESKEEVEILINGIKQPITNNLDKKLIEELYPLKRKTEIEVKENSDHIEEHISKLEKALKEFSPFPKIIISNDSLKGTLYTGEINIINSLIKIKTSGFGRVSFMNIKINCFIQVDEIEIEDNKKINPKQAYKIADSVYIWFSEKHNN